MRKRKQKIVKSSLATDRITINEVAEILGTGVRTAWRYDSLEKIPAGIQIGRTKYWSKRELDLWWELGCPDRATFEQEKRKHLK